MSGITYTTDLATTQGLIVTEVNAQLTAAGADFQAAFNGDKLEFTDQDGER